jgi:predicted component of type VI protein secretion system
MHGKLYIATNSRLQQQQQQQKQLTPTPAAADDGSNSSSNNSSSRSSTRISDAAGCILSKRNSDLQHNLAEAIGAVTPATATKVAVAAATAAVVAER